ncbi:MAG: preprotein translocase subunit SecG [Clostridia bacterium]|nr:preprotein translocase subunit SecG [Clostridia bacterium]MDE6791066.1 preprotein translocase subunit SecG [Clostridia bacterium]
MGDPQYTTYVVLTTIAIVAMFLAALVAIILVLLQQSNSEGIQGITGSSETFFGKNKGQSIESKLKKWTWICLGVLSVIAIVFYVVTLILH